MHEMALAESLVELIEEEVRKHTARRVKTVRLAVGALATVEPEALAFCFDAAARGAAARPVAGQQYPGGVGAGDQLCPGACFGAAHHLAQVPGDGVAADAQGFGDLAGGRPGGRLAAACAGGGLSPAGAARPVSGGSPACRRPAPGESTADPDPRGCPALSGRSRRGHPRIPGGGRRSRCTRGRP